MIERSWRALKTSIAALALEFSDREGRLLSIAAFANAFSSWCFMIALGVYGFEAHGAVGVGIVAIFRYLPGAVASPLVGLLIDRYSRRSVMLASSISSAAVLGAAAAAAALGAPIDVVFIFPALFAVTSSGYNPAHAAMMPALAKTPQELSASNVTHSAMENGGSLFAALAAGLLLGPTSPAFVFGVAAGTQIIVAILISQVHKDSRPQYVAEDDEIAGRLNELTLGLRTLAGHPALRLSTVSMALLLLFEGFADVLVVVMALELLHLDEGSVGFLNATWGFGAILGAVALAFMLDRGKLVVAIAGGSLFIGIATLLPAISPQAPLAYLAWLGIGFGFVFVEVAAKTLMQRLGDDESLGRVIGSLESVRYAAMALGSFGAVVLVQLIGVRGALVVLAALMPVFVLFCWRRLRGYEIGAPVAEGPYNLLRGNSIFAPLPIATLERLSHDLMPVEYVVGEEVIVQGEIGDRFYLIEHGEVEVFENDVFRRNEGPGESFGEIALLHDVPRTATVRTTSDARLLVLNQDQFLVAVTGHRRSNQFARAIVDERWLKEDDAVPHSD